MGGINWNGEKVNAIVGQSGGPTAAINATLAGVISGAYSNESIGEIFGASNGVEGILEGRLRPLSEMIGADELPLLSATPSAALGSCRKKLPSLNDSGAKEVYKRIFDIFKQNNIRYFFYIGGNDSMDTVSKLTDYSAREDNDWKIRAVGVPKTIDNDLRGTDHTPGYGSAAKFVATTMREILCDCAVYTVPAVTVVEVMGRDAGWLTMSAALPGYAGGAAPDLVYLPERVFDIDDFLIRVRAALEKHPNVVVAVSEGIRGADGEYIGAGTHSGALDVFGHKYLSGTGKALERIVKEKIGCKVRSVELNILQRCASHIASGCDIEESQRIGRAAVEAAVNGASGVMMGFVRRGASAADYSVEIAAEDIKLIANEARVVPDEYITPDGCGITPAGIDYMLPLISGEAPTFFENGLPRHITLDRA